MNTSTSSQRRVEAWNPFELILGTGSSLESQTHCPRCEKGRYETFSDSKRGSVADGTGHETNSDLIHGLEKQSEEGAGGITKLKRARNSWLSSFTTVPPKSWVDLSLDGVYCLQQQSRKHREGEKTVRVFRKGKTN